MSDVHYCLYVDEIVETIPNCGEHWMECSCDAANEISGTERYRSLTCATAQVLSCATHTICICISSETRIHTPSRRVYGFPYRLVDTCFPPFFPFASYPHWPGLVRSLVIAERKSKGRRFLVPRVCDETRRCPVYIYMCTIPAMTRIGIPPSGDAVCCLLFFSFFSLGTRIQSP